MYIGRPQWFRQLREPNVHELAVNLHELVVIVQELVVNIQEQSVNVQGTISYCS